jgi:hypothetical protein
MEKDKPTSVQECITLWESELKQLRKQENETDDRMRKKNLSLEAVRLEICISDLRGVQDGKKEPTTITHFMQKAIPDMKIIIGYRGGKTCSIDWGNVFMGDTNNQVLQNVIIKLREAITFVESKL